MYIYLNILFYVASWHPSKLGHELRAAHYSFFWLHIYKDALISIEKMLITHNEKDNDKEGHNSLHITLQEVQKRVEQEHKYIPIEPMYNSTYGEYEPC